MTTSAVANTIQELGPCPIPAPAIEHYRDLSDSTCLVVSRPGMFWCYTHMADLPFSEQSPDPRFCYFCHGILMMEYRDMVTTRGKRKPWWTPANGSSHTTTPQVQEQGALIMSTVNDKQTEVDKINPTPPDGRGRKPQPLPVERIKQLAFDGMGSKAIAHQLQTEGIAVSYKTVQRRLWQAVTA